MQGKVGIVAGIAPMEGRCVANLELGIEQESKVLFDHQHHS